MFPKREFFAHIFFPFVTLGRSVDIHVRNCALRSSSSVYQKPSVVDSHDIWKEILTLTQSIIIAARDMNIFIKVQVASLVTSD